MNKRLIFNTVLVTFCLVDGCHRMWSTERGLRSDCVCSFWRCTLHHYGRKRMIHWRLENIYVYNIKITSCQRNQKKAIKLTSHTECIILIKWNASHSIDLWHICMAWAKWTWARCNDAPKHLSLICHTNSMMISRRNEEKALRRSWATHLFLSLSISTFVHVLRSFVGLHLLCCSTRIVVSSFCSLNLQDERVLCVCVKRCRCIVRSTTNDKPCHERHNLSAVHCSAKELRKWHQPSNGTCCISHRNKNNHNNHNNNNKNNIEESYRARTRGCQTAYSHSILRPIWYDA